MSLTAVRARKESHSQIYFGDLEQGTWLSSHLKSKLWSKLLLAAYVERGAFSSPEACALSEMPQGSLNEQASSEPPGWFTDSPKTLIIIDPFKSASPCQPQ